MARAPLTPWGAQASWTSLFPILPAPRGLFFFFFHVHDTPSCFAKHIFLHIDLGLV